MRLLLISNSTMSGEPFLNYPKLEIQKFLKPAVQKVLFIPYAGVTISYNDYNEKVRTRFAEIDLGFSAITEVDDPLEAIKNAQAIVVGGGNTFRLLELLQKNNLIEPIRNKVLNNTPFIGWSAGANIACPTICTTNDMPIVAPPSFSALQLVPFQINPHYTDSNPEGHAGETREDRIREFMVLNNTATVIGLREGTMLKIENHSMQLIGNNTARIFRPNKAPFEMATGFHDFL